MVRALFVVLFSVLMITPALAQKDGAVAAPVEGELISRPVGEVDDHIVTSREVQLNYIVERALVVPAKKFASENHYLDPSSYAFRRELNGVFLERVVDLQAKTMSLAGLEKQDLARALEIVKIVEKSNVWKNVRASSSEIEGVVSRKLRAKKFIKQKAESSQVDPTDEEVRDFYEKNRDRFPFSFESRKEQLRRAKRRKDANDRLQEWFKNLQNQYKVKTYLTPGQ